MYLAMQLDNEGTSRDLEKLQKVRLAINPECEKIDDIFSVTYVRYKQNNPKIFFDDELILSDSELKRVQKMLKPEKFSEFESIYLKIYTFLAQITNQIQNFTTQTFSTPMGKEYVKKKYENILGALMENQTVAELILSTTQNKCDYTKKIANSFNNGIYKIMQRYFK